MFLSEEQLSNFQTQLKEAKEAYLLDLEEGREADENAGKVHGFEEIITLHKTGGTKQDLEDRYDSREQMSVVQNDPLWKGMLHSYKEVLKVLA